MNKKPKPLTKAEFETLQKVRDVKGYLPRKIVPMLDPILLPGSTHTATVPVIEKPSGMACTAELYLTTDGTTKVATSGPQPFTSMGVSQNVPLEVIMPTPGGLSYMVYIDIVSGGVVIDALQGSENVIVPSVTIGPITWE